MASPEKQLSTAGGEKTPEIDANAEDSTVKEVGGPEPTWSTANYANFKFDATVGVSPDSSKASDAEVAAEKGETLKEDEACPVCGEAPCSCDTIKEVEHDEEVPAAEEPPPAPMAAEEDVDAPVADEDEVSADVPVEDDDTMELDLSDLVDEDEDVVELPMADVAADEPVADEPVADAGSDEGDDEDDFVPTEEDKVWEDDAEMPMVDVAADDDEDEDKPVQEADEPEAGEGHEDEKKQELAEEGDEDEAPKKDEDEKPLEEEDEKDEDDEDDEDAPKKAEMSEGKIRVSFNIKEASKLFERNTVLTEADKRQSRVLFESAVRSVAKQVGRQLQEAYQQRFTAMKKQHEQKVAKQVDAYMSYVVEQWAADNKVALQNQLRNRLTESFLAGFKKLCVEHYIEVPESKVNVVEALAKNVKSLKTKLKATEAKNVKLHEDAKAAVKRERIALKKEHKGRLIAEAASAVTPADRGSFVQRAQTMSFTTTKEFKKDLIALREQYFGAKTSVERPTNEPVAAPIFESKKPTNSSSVDLYTKVADRLTRQS